MNRKPKKADAILALDPNSIFVIRELEIEWIENPSSLNEEQIQAKLAELQAEYDSKQYQRDRAYQYPSIQEQLDMQYWDSVDGTTTWKDAIAKVKTDNPKPT